MSWSLCPPLPSPPPPRPTPLWTCHPHRPSNTYMLLPTTTFPQVHLDQPCNALRTRILSSSRNARSLLTKPPHCMLQSWKKIVFELWICWLSMDKCGISIYTRYKILLKWFPKGSWSRASATTFPFGTSPGSSRVNFLREWPADR